MENIEANWTGPYSWPRFEAHNGLPILPRQSGLYLQTFEYEDGYLIYAAGLTRRSFAERMREHTRKYNEGDYNVFSLDGMKRGVRQEVWHGWGWTPEKRAEFASKREVISEAVQQLAGFRLFVAEIETESRALERLEAAVMNTLYQQSAPLCDIPDQGMRLAPRRKSEAIIVARNQRDVMLHGLPDQLER